MGRKHQKAASRAAKKKTLDEAGFEAGPDVEQKEVVEQKTDDISAAVRQEEQNFEDTNANAALTYPMQASALRKNGYCLLKDHPCKIVEMTTSKTGKHGHAKVHFTGIDIFTGRKYEALQSSTHNMYVPIVNRQDYELMDISQDNYLLLLREDGSTKEDLPVPEGALGAEIKAKLAEGVVSQVSVLSSMGVEQAIERKDAPRGNN